jgi:hypothetical protein
MVKYFLEVVLMVNNYLPDSAASHAKPSMEEAILCMGWNSFKIKSPE